MSVSPLPIFNSTLNSLPQPAHLLPVLGLSRIVTRQLCHVNYDIWFDNIKYIVFFVAETRDASVQVECVEECAQEAITDNQENRQNTDTHEETPRREQNTQNTNCIVTEVELLPDDANFTSVEDRNLFDNSTPVWCEQSGRRLANRSIPSPLVERRTIVWQNFRS